MRNDYECQKCGHIFYGMFIGKCPDCGNYCYATLHSDDDKDDDYNDR